MSFKLAQVPAGPAVPRIIEKDLATATLTKGALLVVDANGEYAECGADPAAVAAVAATAAGTGGDYQILPNKEFPAGKMQGITVEGTVFRAKYTGSLPAANGGNYGVVKDGNGDWVVDFTDTTNVVVKLVDRLTDEPESGNEVLVKFLDGIIQQI